MINKPTDRTVLGVVTVLKDRRGIEWRTAPEYQDNNVNGVGWLMMESSIGEKLTYASVVNDHGYRDDRVTDRPYLVGYIE